MNDEIKNEIAKGNHEKAVILYYRLAASHLKKKKFEKALPIFLQGLAHAQSNLERSNSHLDHLYYAIASLNFHDLADMESAYYHYENGLQWAKDNENKERIAFYTDHLAMVELHRNRYKESLQLLDEVDSWLAENKKREIDFYFHMMIKGFVLFNLDNADGAIQCILSVLPVPMEDPFTNMLLYTLLLRCIHEKSAIFTQDRISKLLDKTPLSEITPESIITHLQSMYHDNDSADSKVRMLLELERFNKHRGENTESYFDQAVGLAMAAPRRLPAYLIKDYY